MEEDHQTRDERESALVHLLSRQLLRAGGMRGGGGVSFMIECNVAGWIDCEVAVDLRGEQREVERTLLRGLLVHS